MDGEVKRIEAFRNDVDQQLEYCRTLQDKRVPPFWLTDDEGCQVYYNEEDIPIKQTKRYDGEAGSVYVEAYYGDPAEGAEEGFPVFCRAATEDGREYQLYWKDLGIDYFGWDPIG